MSCKYVSCINIKKTKKSNETHLNDSGTQKFKRGSNVENTILNGAIIWLWCH